MSTPPDSTLDIAGGDVGLSRHFKDLLRLLAKRSDEPAFSRLIVDVLSGKRSLREAYTEPALHPGHGCSGCTLLPTAGTRCRRRRRRSWPASVSISWPSSGSSPTQRPRKGFVATMTTSTSTSILRTDW